MKQTIRVVLANLKNSLRKNNEKNSFFHTNN